MVQGLHTPRADCNKEIDEMNILTRNFASTRPVQIATWTYKRYNLIVIFASTRPVQIATQCASRTVRVQAFASTRSVQIATVYQ